MGGAAGPDFTQQCEIGEREMTQTLEGIPAAGRSLGRLVTARRGGGAVLEASPSLTVSAGHRGVAAAR
jgi:hypothetical protein